MEIPRRLGDYEVLLELATGGVATVWLARHAGDAGFERLVAIKRVHRHLLRDPDVFASLADEARLSALVRHPNVVPTNEVLDQRGELLLVQEYVEGVSLAMLHRRAVDRGDLLPVPVIVRVVVDLLRGLHAAHEAVDLRGEPLDLVHRDVSPQNVLVGVDGSSRLIDFGVARAEGRITETRAGILKGKLAYMAPEQVGERAVDRRADLFAAGVVLVELLVGARPFDGVGDAECMARILAAEPDLTKVAARAPALAALVSRALSREPSERWATAESFAEALAEAVRPASDGAVRKVVDELVGDVVASRREAMREQLGRDDPHLADDVVDGAIHGRSAADLAPGASAAGATPAAAPRAPSRALLITALAAAAIAAVTVVATASRSADRGVRAATSSAASPTPGVTERVALAPSSGFAVAPLAPSVLPTASSPPAPVPSVALPRALGPTALPPAARMSSSPPASASSQVPARPDLHDNPYGR